MMRGQLVLLSAQDVIILQRYEFNSGRRAKTYGNFAAPSLFSDDFLVSNTVFGRPMG